MKDDCVYKILTLSEWSRAQRKGAFGGSAVDRADGFLHFSTAQQVRETAEKHFAGQPDLCIAAISIVALEAVDAGKLRWEKSRGGALFPHWYGDLLMSTVAWWETLPCSDDGAHRFPARMNLL